MSTHSNPFVRSAIATVTAVSMAAAATGCAEDDQDVEQEMQEQIDELQNEVERLGEELDEEVGEVDEDLGYDGLYGEEFTVNIKDFDEQRVRVTGAVEEVVAPNAFTLGGDGVADLLIVSVEDTQEIREGSIVAVTGTAHIAFDIPGVEDDIGRDLDDETFEEWNQGPYVAADQVETTAN